MESLPEDLAPKKKKKKKKSNSVFNKDYTITKKDVPFEIWAERLDDRSKLQDRMPRPNWLKMQPTKYVLISWYSSGSTVENAFNRIASKADVIKLQNRKLS